MENARWFNSFGENGGLNRNSDTALNTILFIPDTITLDNIRSSVDVSQIEDVQYLQEKYITCLGLPKGYLLADDSPTRGESLIEQDLSFAQRIPYIQDAYLEYVHNLLTKIAFYVGADMSALEIQLFINSPHRLTSKSIETYTNGMNLIKDHIAFRKEINPDYRLSDNQLKIMVQKVGLDPEIFDISGDITPYSASGGSLETSGFGGTSSGFGAPAGGDEGGFGQEPTGFNSPEVGTTPTQTNESLVNILNVVKESMINNIKPYKTYITESSEVGTVYVNLGEYVYPYQLFKTFLRK